MDYIKIYNKIITIGKFRIKTNNYYEKHHIIPKCLGGDNKKNNIVLLTAKEHYLVHYILIKIYPENEKLIYAFWMMCNGSKTGRFIPSSKSYDHAKKLFSKNMRGKKSPMKNKKHSEGSKLKMSIATKNRLKENNVWKGKIHSKESRLKQSVSAKNRNISEKMELQRREGISKSSKGRKTSKEASVNLSNAKKGIKNPMFGKTGKDHHNSKPVLQFDLNNKVIKEWENAKIASEKLNLSYKAINANCINKTKTSQGFIWKYKLNNND